MINLCPPSAYLFILPEYTFILIQFHSFITEGYHRYLPPPPPSPMMEFPIAESGQLPSLALHCFLILWRSIDVFFTDGQFPLFR